MINPKGLNMARPTYPIELMICIVVIGICAASALTIFSTALKKSILTHAIGISDELKKEMSVAYALTGVFPETMNEISASTQALVANNVKIDRHVQSVTLSDHTIHVHLAGKLKGKTLSYLPLVTKSNFTGNVYWSVFSNTPSDNEQALWHPLGICKTSVNEKFISRYLYQ